MLRKWSALLISIFALLTSLEAKDLHIFQIAEFQSDGPATLPALGADFLEYFGFDFHDGKIGCVWADNSQLLVNHPPAPTSNLGYSSIQVNNPHDVIVSQNLVIAPHRFNFQGEPTLAIDKTNKNNISVCSFNVPLSFVNKPLGQIHQFSKGMLFANTSDGGETWVQNKSLARIFNPRNSKNKLPLGFDNGDFRLVYDSQGHLYITYLTIFTHSIFDVFSVNRKHPLMGILAMSEDHGKTFEVQYVFNPIKLGKKQAAYDYPLLAAGDDQVVWLASVFNQGNVSTAASTQNPSQIFIFPKKKNGQLGDPVHIQNPEGLKGGYGSVAINPTGGILISQASFNGELGSTIQDHSTIWTSFIPKGAKKIPKDTQFQLFGDVNVGYFATYPPQPDRKTWCQPRLAYVSHKKHFGRAYMVYVDNLDPVNEPNNTDIFIAFTDDDGQTWSEPFQITKNKHTQYEPQIAIDQTTGNIGVAWLDARNDPNDVLVQVFGTVIPANFFD